MASIHASIGARSDSNHDALAGARVRVLLFEFLLTLD